MDPKSAKSKSVKQQRLFGMVHAVQKGEMKPPSKQVAEIARDISESDAKDFAETKHKGLPVKKDKKASDITLRAQLVTNYIMLKRANMLPMPPRAGIPGTMKPNSKLNLAKPRVQAPKPAPGK